MIAPEVSLPIPEYLGIPIIIVRIVCIDKTGDEQRTICKQGKLASYSRMLYCKPISLPFRLSVRTVHISYPARYARPLQRRLREAPPEESLLPC